MCKQYMYTHLQIHDTKLIINEKEQKMLNITQGMNCNILTPPLITNTLISVNLLDGISPFQNGWETRIHRFYLQFSQSSLVHGAAHTSIQPDC